MLDQNTDRMWFVIGAVIVGAAIIFIANGTLPDIFASVTETFKDSATEAENVMYNINPNLGESRENLIDSTKVMTVGASGLSYDSSTGIYSLNVNPASSWYASGIRPNRRTVWVPYGETYTLSYEVRVPEEYSETYAVTDINNFPNSDVSWGNAYGTALNDNDDIPKRVTNGRPHGLGTGPSATPKFKITPGQWTQVWVSYSNTNPYNKEQLDIYDYTSAGVYHEYETAIPIQIRNLKGELGGYPTP